MKLSSKTNELFSLLIVAIIGATAAVDNECGGPLREITYRFNAGSCAETNALISQDLFSCEDSGNSLIGIGTYYIEASGSGDSLYFAGPVAIGSEYTLNQAGAFDSLGSATIKVYTTQGGELLQTVTINDMTCNNPLFLFDTFGASQITKWTETSGRVVTSNVGMSKENAETDVDVDISTNNGGPEVMEAGPPDADISTSSGGVEVMEAGSSAATANTITATIAAAVVVTVASVITLI